MAWLSCRCTRIPQWLQYFNFLRIKKSMEMDSFPKMGYVCICFEYLLNTVLIMLNMMCTGPPTITTHPASQLTNVSISVTLDCEGTGRGSIKYHWESKKGDTKWMNIRNRKTLVVKNLQRSQQYRCVVSNEAGSTRSNVATVTVLSKLFANISVIIILITGISNQPMSHTVTALTDATLHCSTSVDGARYLWHRVNGTIPSRSQGQSSSTLTIPRAIPPDEGMYYCIISKDSVTVESDRATLEVNGRLVFVIVDFCTRHKIYSLYMYIISSKDYLL